MNLDNWQKLVNDIASQTNPEIVNPEDYESEQPITIISANDVVTRKPYPSTRNKLMPKYFISEETLFSAAKYETDNLHDVSQKIKGKACPFELSYSIRLEYTRTQLARNYEFGTHNKAAPKQNCG